MATPVGDVPAADVAPIQTEIERKQIYINPDRYGSGRGRTQAFGVIRRWSYRPWVSRNCWLRPELWQALLDFAAKHVHIPWDAVQVNQGYESKPHRDVGNRGDSYIISFGDYTGGELVVDVSGEEQVVDTRLRGHLFNGSKLRHWNRPIAGTKFSLVFFSIEYPKFWPESRGKPTITTVTDDGQVWVKIEDCDGAVYRARGTKWITDREPTVLLDRVGKVQGFGGKSFVPGSADRDAHSV